MNGEIFNVGGGCDGSLLLVELIGLCWDLIGHVLDIGCILELRLVDVLFYLFDC